MLIEIKTVIFAILLGFTVYATICALVTSCTAYLYYNTKKGNLEQILDMSQGTHQKFLWRRWVIYALIGWFVLAIQAKWIVFS